MLSLRSLSVSRGRSKVLQDISFGVQGHEFIGLIGPNGAGKTTLLRALQGLLPHQGESSLAKLAPFARARHAAFLPQAREIAWPVSVETLVQLGRAPHGTGETPADRRAVAEALARVGLSHAAGRNARSLSGGELARALIARALAQDTPLLLADEPAAGLDPEHQLRMMALFRDLAAQGKSVIASVHDLGLAARFCTRVLVLGEGRLLADGPPEVVMTDDLLARVFGLRVHHIETPEGRFLLPLGVIG